MTSRQRSRAAAGIAAVTLVGAGYLLLRPHPADFTRQAPSEPAPGVRVVSAEVGGGPAKAIFYRTPTALFIWLAPTKGTGG